MSVIQIPVKISACPKCLDTIPVFTNGWGKNPYEQGTGEHYHIDCPKCKFKCVVHGTYAECVVAWNRLVSKAKEPNE